jgi:hypothetical protein
MVYKLRLNPESMTMSGVQRFDNFCGEWEDFPYHYALKECVAWMCNRYKIKEKDITWNHWSAFV